MLESAHPETRGGISSPIRWLLTCIALVASPAFAQWTTHALPVNGRIIAVMDADTPSGHILFAEGTTNHNDWALYASVDDGATWEPRSIPGYANRFIMWAGTRPTPDGLPSRRGDLYVTLIVPSSAPIEPCDILRSSDQGATWSVVATNVGACALAFDPTSPERLFGLGRGEVAALIPVILRSDTGGASWEFVDTKLQGRVQGLRVGADGTVYGLTTPMIVSHDQGNSWTVSSFPPLDGATPITLDLLTWRHPAYGSQFAVAATTTGLYTTIDAGVSWQASGLQGFTANSLAKADTAGDQDSAVIVGLRDGLVLMADSGLIPLANGLPDISDYYGPVGGPYVASSIGVSRCADLTLCEGGSLPAMATLVEFHNTTLDHYFMTTNPAEAAGIDNGSAGPGWVRTGYAYPVFANPIGTPDAQPMCRFYGTPGRGPNSHFFTLDRQECAVVEADPGWMLESAMAFAAAAPIARLTFPAGTITYDCGNRHPVFRLYNNRYAQNDSNHRYTTSTVTYQQMQQLGWRAEGVVFCAAAQ